MHDKETKQNIHIYSLISIRSFCFISASCTRFYPSTCPEHHKICLLLQVSRPVASSVLLALLCVVSIPIVCLLQCTLVRHPNHTDFAVGLERWYRVLKEGKIEILVCQHFQNIWSCKFPNICSQMLLIINLRTVCQHNYILNSSASCEPMHL